MFKQHQENWHIVDKDWEWWRCRLTKTPFSRVDRGECSSLNVRLLQHTEWYIEKRSQVRKESRSSGGLQIRKKLTHNLHFSKTVFTVKQWMCFPVRVNTTFGLWSRAAKTSKKIFFRGRTRTISSRKVKSPQGSEVWKKKKSQLGVVPVAAHFVVAATHFFENCWSSFFSCTLCGCSCSSALFFSCEHAHATFHCSNVILNHLPCQWNHLPC